MRSSQSSSRRLRQLLHMQVLLLALALVARRPPRRCLLRTRLKWASHSQALILEGQFTRKYRMSFEAFEELVMLLAPALTVDELQSRRRTGTDAISPVNQVTMCIRWLGGGSYNDTRATSGVSKTAFYTSVHRVIDALIKHPDLMIKFPVDEESVRQRANDFAQLSSHSALTGCVGAIDGWLCPIRVPRKTEVGRVTAFFSGHYQRYGVNVQVCCDHLCRFTAVSCSSAGGCGDSLAFARTGRSQLAMNLPFGYYLVGDNAFANSRYLLTPYPKPKISSDYHDSYNFHLSELRIRIEMAFGLLVKKWRIFRAPLEVRFANVPKLIIAACILHNYCINARVGKGPIYNPAADIAQATASGEATTQRRISIGTDNIRDRSVPDDDDHTYRMMYSISDPNVEQHVESEWLRDTIVRHLENNNIRRPHRNIVRHETERSNQERENACP